MKSMLRTVRENDITYQALLFVCPGCASVGGDHHTGLHLLPVNSETKSPSWGFNGDLELPSLTPSILTQGQWRCHSYLTDGVFAFLEDSEHEFKGQHIPIPDLPEWAYDLYEEPGETNVP